MNKALSCLVAAVFAAVSVSTLAQSGGDSRGGPVPADKAAPGAPASADAKVTADKVAADKLAADKAAASAAEAEQRAKRKAADKAWRERTKPVGQARGGR